MWGVMDFFEAIDLYKLEGHKGIRRIGWPEGEYLYGELSGPSTTKGTSYVLTSPVEDGLTSTDWEIVPNPPLEIVMPTKLALPKAGDVLYIREKEYPNFRPWKQVTVTASGRDSFLAVGVKNNVIELHIKQSTHEWSEQEPEK